MVNKKEINWDEVAELSGETTVKATRYIVPVLKFNGNDGKFTELILESGGGIIAEPAKNQEPEIVILKVRRIIQGFVKAQPTSIRYFTSEHNSWKDIVPLFEKRGKDDRIKYMGQGTSKDLRNKFPESNLKLKQWLYCLVDGQIMKFGVKGKSLSSLVEYFKSFSPKEHLCQYYTKLTEHEETNEGGLTYHVVDFTRGEPVEDPLTVIQYIKDVAEALALQDKANADYQRVEEEVPGTSETIKEESVKPEPEGEDEEKTEIPGVEEVRVEDIPY